MIYVVKRVNEKHFLRVPTARMAKPSKAIAPSPAKVPVLTGITQTAFPKNSPVDAKNEASASL